jgi:hypothetical protein
VIRDRAEKELNWLKERLKEDLDPAIRECLEIAKRSLESWDQPIKVFDWDKAARIIRAQRAAEASAGLLGDWNATADTILEEGKPLTNCRVYLASRWALPALEIAGEEIECWCMESDAPGWTKDTVWPESALRILEET